MRHELKPQAYVRYGDDFVLFYPTRRKAYEARMRSCLFLQDELKMYVNPKNDVVATAHSGLKFLGHDVTATDAIVDQATSKSVLNKVDWHNVASYRALYLDKNIRPQLDWILLAKNVDI